MSKEPDWKHIAHELARRLNFAITYGKFSGFYLNIETGESHSTLDYLADGMEMFPGVKVNRELLHMSPAQRRKAAKSGLTPPNTRD